MDSLEEESGCHSEETRRKGGGGTKTAKIAEFELSPPDKNQYMQARIQEHV